MRIRNILVISFLLIALVPTAFYGIWSYNQGVQREFDEVRERHLLIAENLGYALERYALDLSAAFDSVSAAMVAEQDMPRLGELMARLHIVCILIVDAADGRIHSRVDLEQSPPAEFAPEPVLEAARAVAVPGLTTYSPVMEGPAGANEILAVHDYGDRLAIARVDTGYFVRLGKSVAFGERGHAAIVDREGNILAHPLPDWVASRRNIAAVSAVQRMMAGETGIQQFYSPALKGDMISGFTSVPGPGWGVMVPQPVSELYDKVAANTIGIGAVLLGGVTLSALIVAILLRSLVTPLEKMVERLKSNTRSRQLLQLHVEPGWLPVSELADYERSYNRMVETVSEAHRKNRELAQTDSVTGLLTAARFQELSKPFIEQASAHDTAGALIYLDLDDFKEINDLHGHDAGDRFLRLCAEQVVTQTNACVERLAAESGAPIADPLIGRIGGDEFAIVVPGLASATELRGLMQRLREDIAALTVEMNVKAGGAVSIGAAVYPADSDNADELLKLADIAMYQAKNAGKNKVEIYHPSIGRQNSAELRQDVLRAIEQDELTLEYQPKIRAEDWAPNSAEALVRWNHPEKGMIPPGAFLPAIMETAIVTRLGEWVVERAIRDYPVWAGSAGELKVAVNFSSRHFAAPGFADWLGDTLNKASFDSSRLMVEITEDTLLTSVDQAPDTIARLHEFGIGVSIDDFGKGYSNIARLAELHFNQLKIDRSIIGGAPHNPRLLAIMRSILDMARELGCETVAEGIESMEQAEFMARQGATMLQGFYFSKSLPPAKLSKWIARFEENPVRDRHAQLSRAFGS